MSFSSVSSGIYRDNSPLSPTVIHYHQKYQLSNVSHNHHRNERYRYRRRHRHQKQQIPHTSQIISPFRQDHHSRKTNKILRQQESSCLWEIHKSSTGRIYYYNIITDQSQWERPSSITKKSIHTNHIQSKRNSNNKNYLSRNNQYEQDLFHHSKYSKQSTRTTINHSSSNLISTFDNSLESRISNNNNLTKTIITNNHKRMNNNIEENSSLKKFRKDQLNNDKILFPILKSSNEIIQVDLIDPIPTTTINIPISSNSCQQSPIINENIFKLLDEKHLAIPLINFETNSSNKFSINSKSSSFINLSSNISQSSLYPSSSTINAILQLEHSLPIILPVKHQSSPPSWSNITNSNYDDITRYYRGDLIEHLLNWPSTQIEREIDRLLNEQIRSITRQLISLRTDIYCIRLRFERNRFQLFNYCLINKNKNCIE